MLRKEQSSYWKDKYRKMFKNMHSWGDVYGNKDIVSGDLTWKFTPRKLFNKDSYVSLIGNCWTQDLSIILDQLPTQIKVPSYQIDVPENREIHFNDSGTLRQQFELAVGGLKELHEEPLWKTSKGYVHPFLEYHKYFKTEKECRVYADKIFESVKDSILNSDVIFITIGIVEHWINPKNNLIYRTIPHPDIINDLQPEFKRQTTQDVLDDLEKIYNIILLHNKDCKVILDMTPATITSTFTDLDVRQASRDGISRIRAAIGEFVEKYPDISHFPSYELIYDSKDWVSFMQKDYRHITYETQLYLSSMFIDFYGDGIEYHRDYLNE